MSFVARVTSKVGKFSSYQRTIESAADMKSPAVVAAAAVVVLS